MKLPRWQASDSSSVMKNRVANAKDTKRTQNRCWLLVSFSVSD
jgi:hypothetical protein